MNLWEIWGVWCVGSEVRMSIGVIHEILVLQHLLSPNMSSRYALDMHFCKAQIFMISYGARNISRVAKQETFNIE